jgi:hypothetical protein
MFCTAAGAFYVPLQIPLPFIGKVLVSAVLAMGTTLWLHPASLWALCGAAALYGVVFLCGLVLLKPLSGRDSDSLHQVNQLLGKWAEKLFVDMRATVAEGRA